MKRLTLSILEENFVVCRLPADAPTPTWASGGSISSITRTADELSIVCVEDLAPDRLPSDAKIERGWACLKVEGPLDFSLIGILAGLATALADVGISIFALSTYDTDYILLKHDSLELAVETLRRIGYEIIE